MTMKERAVTELRMRILAGEFDSEEDLQEITIANQLGMSRTPVREAFLVLQQESLVKIVPNKGARVITLSNKDIIQISQARIAIELMATELAIDKIDQKLLTDLIRVIDEELEFVLFHKNELICKERFRKTNNIHEIILQASENVYLINMNQSLSKQLERIHGLTRKVRAYELVLLEHKEIVNAFVARDVVRAKDALKVHIYHAMEEALTLDTLH